MAEESLLDVKGPDWRSLTPNACNKGPAEACLHGQVTLWNIQLRKGTPRDTQRGLGGAIFGWRLAKRTSIVSSCVDHSSGAGAAGGICPEGRVYQPKTISFLDHVRNAS